MKIKLHEDQEKRIIDGVLGNVADKVAPIVSGLSGMIAGLQATLSDMQQRQVSFVQPGRSSGTHRYIYFSDTHLILIRRCR